MPKTRRFTTNVTVVFDVYVNDAIGDDAMTIALMDGAVSAAIGNDVAACLAPVENEHRNLQVDARTYSYEVN